MWVFQWISGTGFGSASQQKARREGERGGLGWATDDSHLR